MGEVYKARDTRLDRTVAIKVIPEHLAESPERKARFKREARAISQLNHPNICTLYDVGEQNGVDFIVMEYIEGETLADRLSRGALSFDDALEYGIQITGALERAHRDGIAHRDLKPANILLTKSGAKLADFGLAKMYEREAGLVRSEVPTAERPLTDTGAIMGTLQYMSPEQLEGKEADGRTDIFAFGATLYEMLTGQKAFKGKSQASLIAAILEHEPPSISIQQPMSPPALDRVVRQCLAKDPDERWQTAGDLKRELEWLTSASARVDEDPVATPSGIARARRSSLVFGAVGLSVGAAIAGALAWTLKPTPRPAVTRFDVTLPETLIGRGPVALSPDGTRLVYGANGRLYMRSMDGMEAAPIRGTDGENAQSPFFSPDGEWLGFFASDELRKVPVGGGAPVSASARLRGASWGADGSILFAQDQGIFRVSASGGEPEALIEVDAAKSERVESPQLLPDGDTVLFTLVQGDAWDDARIVLHSLETGERKVLVEHGADARYVPSGHLLYALGTSLFAVPMHPSRFDVTGTAIPVLEGVGRGFPETGAAYFAVSRSGTLAYVPSDAVVADDGRGNLVWVDRQGHVAPITSEKRPYLAPRLSHAGDRLAVNVRDRFDADVWVLDLARGTMTRVTFNGGWTPAWTPDDRRVTYGSRFGSGVYRIWWTLADGSGSPESLVAEDDPLLAQGVLNPFDWTPDARTLVVTRTHRGVAGEIGVLSLDGERRLKNLFETRFGEQHPNLSPDGRWLAYSSDESGRREIYVRPFVEGEGRWTISTEGGTEPRWRPDGSEIFYRRGGEVWSVPVVTEPTFRSGSPTLLFEGPYELGFHRHNYDVSHDGERFVMVQRDSPLERPRQRVQLVLNWLDELERLVSTGN